MKKSKKVTKVSKRKVSNVTIPTSPVTAYEILYKKATDAEFVTPEFAARAADHTVHSKVVVAENEKVAEKIFKSAVPISRILWIRKTNRVVNCLLNLYPSRIIKIK